jgi:hypothetical protein
MKVGGDLPLGAKVHHEIHSRVSFDLGISVAFGSHPQHYAAYIQRIINYKADMEFGYDGKHGAYLPHIVWGPTVPSPPPATAAVGTSATTPASSPAYAPSPAVRRPTPSAAPESSCAATHWGKKQSILISGLKTLISMSHSNDALIRESHQQMS